MNHWMYRRMPRSNTKLPFAQYAICVKKGEEPWSHKFFHNFRKDTKERNGLNPLTTRRSKSATLLWKIPVILVLYRYRCNFYTVEPFVSAVRSKKQNHFITDTTHFRSLLVPKSRFFGKKAVHCSGALLKIRKRFSSYLLNGCRYHKNFNRFEF